MDNTALLLLIVYICMAMMFMAQRAMICVGRLHHFDFSVELLASMIWPLSIIYWIYHAKKRTRLYPKPWL